MTTTELALPALFTSVAHERRAILIGLAATYVPRDDAEDVVQQALENAWRRQIQPGRSFVGGRDAMLSWLKSVVSHAALDWLLARRSRPQHWGADLLSDPESPLMTLPDPETPESLYLRWEQKAEACDEARRLLSTLVPRWQRVLWQTVAKEQTQTEVAAQTGMSWQTIKTIRFRAERRLRACALTAQPHAA